MTTTNSIQSNQPLHATGFASTEVVLPGIVEAKGLLVRQRILPSPAAGQVVVRVEASGVSFAERAMRRALYVGQPKFPFVPGYDLVGVVEAVGPHVDSALVGRRVAALTKTGGWASHVSLDAKILMPVPDGVDPVETETLVVNGITAWQMLHRQARVERGQTILVHGASGGVGTTLVQMARHAGVRVIGTASPRHHDALRAAGVEPLDYNDTDLAASVRQLAPQGVAAVFDHIGGKSVLTSYSLLNSSGTLVCYAIASALDTPGITAGSMVKQFMALLPRLAWWSIMPNGHKAVFYNIWAGSSVNHRKFLTELKQDFEQVMELLKNGVLQPQIAARFPLEQIVPAMELAESRTAYGKVVLIPTTNKA